MRPTYSRRSLFAGKPNRRLSKSTSPKRGGKTCKLSRKRTCVIDPKGRYANTSVCIKRPSSKTGQCHYNRAFKAKVAKYSKSRSRRIGRARRRIGARSAYRQNPVPFTRYGTPFVQARMSSESAMRQIRERLGAAQKAALAKRAATRAAKSKGMARPTKTMVKAAKKAVDVVIKEEKPVIMRSRKAATAAKKTTKVRKAAEAVATKRAAAKAGPRRSKRRRKPVSRYGF